MRTRVQINYHKLKEIITQQSNIGYEMRNKTYQVVLEKELLNCFRFLFPHLVTTCEQK